MASLVNKVLGKAAAGQLCKAFGIRLTTNTQVVQLARNAGFDSLFIDLEHSSLSVGEAGALCRAGLADDVTPIVRVPHQCGNGFTQRVLDGGAMGVIFPHIQSADEARAAVAICKYPPVGCRSMTGQLAVFGQRATDVKRVIAEGNASASTVFVMVENKEAVARVDQIAAVDGVDVVLVGSNDLAIELGVPSGFRTDEFRGALESVSRACRAHGKIMGLAGIYNQPDIQEWAIRELGVRYMLCQQDSGLIAAGAVKCAAEVSKLEG